ncbi:MAG TPA: AmmeMemoRadiSam system radical SAM enzyme [Geobacteraceae bacterium]
MLQRRAFLKLLLLSPVALRSEARELIQKPHPAFREALYYDKLDNNLVGCRLCPRTCTIRAGSSGFCRARQNINGALYTLGYAAPCAIHVDPIEKKPFFNLIPKSRSFSIASAGCNLRCKFCQNWEISQVSPLETANQSVPPEEIVSMAQAKGCRSVAFTYTEPTTFFEYMLAAAKAARSRGLMSVYHSNGFISQEPLKELCPWLDAANIDLKGFSSAFYRNVCEAELEPILETLTTLKRGKVWLEITNLVIPGYNDDPAMIRRMAEWIRSNLGAETPLHFSRFFPLYRMTSVPPTPVSTLEKAREIAAKAGLQFVYIGNVPGHAGNCTYCPKCRKLVVRRSGFSVLEMHVKEGKCAFCGKKLAGRWTV